MPNNLIFLDASPFSPNSFLPQCHWWSSTPPRPCGWFFFFRTHYLLAPQVAPLVAFSPPFQNWFPSRFPKSNNSFSGDILTDGGTPLVFVGFYNLILTLCPPQPALSSLPLPFVPELREPPLFFQSLTFVFPRTCPIIPSPPLLVPTMRCTIFSFRFPRLPPSPANPF